MAPTKVKGCAQVFCDWDGDGDGDFMLVVFVVGMFFGFCECNLKTKIFTIV
jgi:hypothetical protein